mgnify:CR=1 FL=1
MKVLLVCLGNICRSPLAEAALRRECADAGLNGINAGALQNARAVEGLTAVLIAINIIHRKG